MIGFGSMLAIPIGTAIAGPVSDAIGIQWWFIIGGIAMILSGVLGFFLPILRNVESERRNTDATLMKESRLDTSQANIE